ncbi:hypothetical protein [Arthrobacter sp. MDT1-65]
MDNREVVAMLTWINQVDPRVMLNEASVETWAYSMRTITPGDAKLAVLEHYRANEHLTATPGTIYKRALTYRVSKDATTRALEAKLHIVKNPETYRARNPEEWDRLKKQGAEDRKADLRARGLIA